MLFRPQFRPLAAFLSIFAAVFSMTLLTSALIAFLAPNTFRSTAQIMVEENQPGPQAAQSGFIDPYFLQTEFPIIQSHVVLSKAVDALNLRDLWGKKYNRGAMSSDQTETILRHNLQLSTIRNTKIIEVRAFSDDPNEAAQLANGVVAAYRSYRIDLARDEASRANNGIESTTKTIPVAIIQPAVPELRPVRPNRPLIIALGLVIGSILGTITGAVSAGLVTLFGGTKTQRQTAPSEPSFHNS